MRYRLEQDGVLIAKGMDVMSIVNDSWETIRDNWKAGFVLYDNADVKFDTWSVVWHDNKIVIDAIYG